MPSKLVLFIRMVGFCYKRRPKKKIKRKRRRGFLIKKNGWNFEYLPADTPFLKTNGLFAKIEAKLYIFNLLCKPGITTEDIGESEKERGL